MNDPFAIRKNVTMSIIAFITNILLVFVSYRLVIRGGGLASLGLWSTLMSWIFVIRLGDVGMATAAVRYIARCDPRTEGRRIRTYVDTSIILNTVLFLLLALIGYAVFYWKLDIILPESAENREIARSILPIMFAGFVASNLSGLVLGALRGIHLAYISAWIMIGGTLIQLITVIFLTPWIGLGGLAFGQLSQHCSMIFCGWITFRRQLRRSTGEAGSILPMNFKMNALKEMFGFSIRAQIANIMNGFFEPMSKILIGQFAGLQILGLYEIAFKLVSLPRNAAVSGVQATVPSITRLLETDKSKAITLYRLSVTKVTRAGGALATASILLSPVVSWSLLGNVETNLIGFVMLLAIGFFVNIIGAPAFVLGTATGIMNNNILSALLSLILLGILMCLVYPLHLPWLLVGCVAAALTFGGVFIKWRNEALLRAKS
jgi:O-antigen/teichoic acid export membrane protein